MIYASQQQLSEYARIQGRGDDLIHESVLPRASRLIDLACGVPAGYFALASEQLSTKNLKPDGTSYLRMPPYVPGSISHCEYSIGWSFVPEYAEYTDNNGIQWLHGCSCFEELPLEITARWGWKQTPDDIVEATIETAMAIWRQSDAAFLRVAADLNGQGGVSGQALPERAKLICAQWKRRLEPVFA